MQKNIDKTKSKGEKRTVSGRKPTGGSDWHSRYRRMVQSMGHTYKDVAAIIEQSESSVNGFSRNLPRQMRYAVVVWETMQKNDNPWTSEAKTAGTPPPGEKRKIKRAEKSPSPPPKKS